jgi:hypothetical protein
MRECSSSKVGVWGFSGGNAGENEHSEMGAVAT